jgi:hypothetical protein
MTNVIVLLVLTGIVFFLLEIILGEAWLSPLTILSEKKSQIKKLLSLYHTGLDL